MRTYPRDETPQQRSARLLQEHRDAQDRLHQGIHRASLQVNRIALMAASTREAAAWGTWALVGMIGIAGALGWLLGALA